MLGGKMYEINENGAVETSSIQSYRMKIQNIWNFTIYNHRYTVILKLLLENLRYIGDIASPLPIPNSCFRHEFGILKEKLFLGQNK